MRQNCLQDTFSILEHLVVPKAKHLPPLARQIRVSDSVATAFRVLETVGFYDQLSANTKKVDDVRADGNLPAKLNPIQAAITQKTPKAQLDASRSAAHRASARALTSGDTWSVFIGHP
jgi:hypothetical protein